MKKVLFLDLDGVLNTERNVRALQNEGKPVTDEYGYLFDEAAVNNLALIIKQTGARIIISSSWKFLGLDKLQSMWEKRKLAGKIVGMTPNKSSDDFLLDVDLEKSDDIYLMCKGQEIKEWLAGNADANIRYAILDDEQCVLEEQKAHFVQVDSRTGITEENAVDVIRMLS